MNWITSLLRKPEQPEPAGHHRDVDRLQARLDTAEGKVEEAVAEAVFLRGRVTELETERDRLLAENVKLADTDGRIAEVAAAELATIGVEAVEESGDQATKMSREEFDRQFNSITDGKARSKWFINNQHRLSK